MAAYYSEATIEEIIERNDIVDVVSDYVKIKRKGKDYFGLCPFHREKTPSFSVVPSKQIYYCFGCGKGGNVINFISSMENVEYIDAIKMLADRASIELPESSDGRERERSGYIKKLIQINTEAARFYHTVLIENPDGAAAKYIEQREIKDSTITRFGMGYSPDSWDSLLNHLVSKGYEQKDIVAAGLASKGRNGQYYDKFRNRIMFPIIDIRNRVIAFGGRLVSGDGPKYMNSPETPAYNKSSSLFGINIAKNSNAEKMIIVEGYMDCVMLHQAGFSNCVASLGTALTIKQARVLKKLVPEVIIAYDMDQAGRAATLRGLDMITGIGCGVKVLELPEGKDPDDYIKNNGSAGFNKLIDSAMSLVEYKAKLLKQKLNINEMDGRMKFLNGVAKAIAQVDNAIEREMYINRISSVYGISAEAIETEVNRNKGDEPAPSQKTNERLGTALHTDSNQEDRSFMSVAAIMCIRPELAGYASQLLDLEFIDREPYRKLFADILRRVEDKGMSDPAIVMENLGDSERELFSAAVAYTETSADMRRTLEEKIMLYKKAVINRRISSISAKLDGIGHKDEEEAEKLRAKLVEAFSHLKNIKKN